VVDCLHLGIGAVGSGISNVADLAILAGVAVERVELLRMCTAD
jgi:lipoprotein signal peptidase